jgi:hypothetical protein
VWVPTTADELELAVNAGTLEEGPHLDGKESLPRRNDELAKDVAAMTADGGVIILGVGEDKHGRLTRLEPIDTAGVAERIDQIVSSSISDTPHVEVRVLPTTADPARGYVAIVVPPSPLAPHQVTVGGDLRYYGRGATGNKKLTEAEVARLYERRRQWERSRAELIERELANPLLPPIAGFAYLFAVARPVATDGRLLELASGDNELAYLQTRLDELRRIEATHTLRPRLTEATQWYRRGASGWVTSSSPEAEQQGAPRYIAHFEIDLDGTTHLFSGRIGQDLDGRLTIFREGVVETFRDFLRLTALIWEGTYVGPVDVAVAGAGLNGGFAYELRGALQAPVFTEDRFIADARVEFAAMSDDPERVARTLLRRLLAALGDSGA